MGYTSEGLFKRFEEIVVQGSENELNFFIENTKDLLKEDPIRYIGLHVNFYAMKEDVLSCLRVVDYYKNAPYISMEVEDMLKEMKEELLKVKKPQNNFSMAKIEEFLFSNEENKIASAISFLSKQNIRSHLDLVRKYLKEDLIYKYKNLVLFILIEQHVDEQFEVLKNGMIYYINPCAICLPFDDFGYMDAKSYIEKSNYNEDIKKFAIELLNTLQIKSFPDFIIDTDDQVGIVSDIVIALAHEAMSLKYPLEEMLARNEISLQKFNAQKDEINGIINS